jgi:hypothetical protein
MHNGEDIGGHLRWGDDTGFSGCFSIASAARHTLAEAKYSAFTLWRYNLPFNFHCPSTPVDLLDCNDRD